MPARRGALPNVLKAMGLDGDERAISIPAMREEWANCRVCGAHLRFGTGDYGQTFEACTNPQCAMSRPHRVTPDLSLLKGPTPAERAYQRRRQERIAQNGGVARRPGNPSWGKAT